MLRITSPYLGIVYCVVLLLGLFAMQSWAQDAAAPPPEETLVDESSAVTPPRTEFEQKTLLDTLRDGGIVGVLIGLLSMVAIGFIVEHFLTIRKSVLMPEEVAFELEEMIGQGRIDEALEVCKHPENQSLLTSVVKQRGSRGQPSEAGFHQPQCGRLEFRKDEQD